ncbi:unnamed protein product [Ixodes hexagonus]
MYTSCCLSCFQVKDNVLNEFFDIDDDTIVSDGDVLRLVQNPFLEPCVGGQPEMIIPEFEILHESPPSPAVLPEPAVFAPTGPVAGSSGYKFPDFPVNICQEIAKTAEGKVTRTLRSKIVKQIVSALCVRTMYPGEHYLTAAKELVSRYPQLKDKSRTHCASWHANIKNRESNVRKRMPAGVTEVDVARAKENARRQDRRAEHLGGQHCVPLTTVRNVQSADYGSGEDEATIEGQVQFMRKEMKKAVWDREKVRDAMDRTHKARRTWINGVILDVSMVTDRYPALARAEEIRQEFKRMTGRDAHEELTEFLEKKSETLYKLFLGKAKSRVKAKQLIQSSQECPEESATLLANGTLILLPCLVKEKCSTFLRPLEPGAQYIHPCVVYTGEDASTSAAYAVTVEDLSIDVASLKQAISLLMCIFGTFNIKYTPEVRNTFVILEHAMGVAHTKMGTLALQVWSSL